MTIPFDQFQNNADAQRGIDAILPPGASRNTVETVMHASGAEVFPIDGGVLCIWETSVGDLMRKRWQVSMAFDTSGQLTRYSTNHGLIGP